MNASGPVFATEAQAKAAAAAFNLGCGVVSESPTRKAARGRTGAPTSKIPLRPIVNTSVAHLSAQGLAQARAVFSTQLHDTGEHGRGAAAAPSAAAAPGLAAARSSASIEQSGASVLTSGNGGAAVPPGGGLSFAIGAAGGQPVGLGTPKGIRPRASKLKSQSPPHAPPLGAHGADAAAPGPPASSPFSPIAMTPMGENTYRNFGASAGAADNASPMDITPQGSATSSVTPPPSNIFLLSPMAGLSGAGAGNQAPAAAGSGPGAFPASGSAFSPAPFPGFAGGFGSEVPPSPAFQPPVSRAPSAGGAAAAASGTAGPPFGVAGSSAPAGQPAADAPTQPAPTAATAFAPATAAAAAANAAHAPSAAPASYVPAAYAPPADVHDKKQQLDQGVSSLAGLGYLFGSSQGANDCQPAKDVAPKGIRISIGGGGLSGSSSNGGFAGSNGAAAAAPGRPAAPAAAPAAAHAPAGPAQGAAPASVPGLSGGMSLAAMEESLEAALRRVREARAAEGAARAAAGPGASPTSGAATAAAAGAVGAGAGAGEPEPGAAKSLLEAIFGAEASVSGGGAPAGGGGTAGPAAAVGPATAAVASMIRGLKLDDALGREGAAAEGPGGGAAAAAAGQAGGAVPAPGDGGASAAAPAPAAGLKVPFVFGGSAPNSGGGAEATAAAAAPAPQAAAPPPQQQPTRPAVPFVFGASAPQPATGSARAGQTGAPPAVPAAAAAAAAGPAGTGPSPLFAPIPAFQFRGSAFSGASAAPSPAVSSASTATASATPLTATSRASGGPSPMSTTPPPTAANSQPPTANQYQPPVVGSSSSGWTNVSHAAAAAPKAAAAGGKDPLFEFGARPGGGGEGVGVAAAAGDAGAGDGIFGRPGATGRARAKVTPRKGRAAPSATGGPPSPSPYAWPAAAPAQPSAAAAAGPRPAPAGGPAPAAPPQQPQRGASQPAPAPQPSGSGSDGGLDMGAVQAVRVKRSADEKKQSGNQKYEQSDFRLAERHYTDALEMLEQQLPALPLSKERLQQLFPSLSTEVAVLYSNRSGARLMTSKPQSALADALRAMALDPKFMRAASRAATCHCRLGDFAGAHRVIDSAMDRCSASSSHYQDMLKKLNEVLDLGARARAATAAAVSAAAAGSRDKLQEAADQLAALRDQVAYCEVVASARAVLALRLGCPGEAMALAAPHPEVALPQRAAPWRLWLCVQARYYRGDMPEALATCQELHVCALAAGNGAADASAAAASPPAGAAAAAYSTSAHVVVPPPAALAELAETLQQLIKLKEDGNAAIKGGRPADAAEQYGRALALGCSPSFAAVLHTNRAAAYTALGQLADAVADCGRARALEPGYYKASARLAGLMLDLRRPENAQGLLEPLTKAAAQANGTGPGTEELATLKERLTEAKAAVSWQKTPQHYKLLGLASTCGEEEVRKAYRRLALRHHPDKAMTNVKVALSLPGTCGGAPYAGPLVGGSELEARVRDEAAWLFNFINQAHEELNDKARRRKVDQLLDAEQPPVVRSANPYGAYGGSRYGGFSSFHTAAAADPYFFYRSTAAAAGAGARARPAAYAAPGGTYAGASRTSATSQGGGPRTSSARPAAGSTGSTAGAAPQARSTGGGGARAGSGAGSNYGAEYYGRPGSGAAGVGGGRRWFEGAGESDEDDADSYYY